MKCPYRMTEAYFEWPGELIYKPLDVENEDGTPGRLHLTNNGRSSVTVQTFADCLKEGCAAWQNGRCVRTG